jgi:hypothetical protein
MKNLKNLKKMKTNNLNHRISVFPCRIGPVRHDGKGRERCPLVLLSSLVPCAGTPKTDRVGRAGHGRHGGEASALCVGSDDVGLDSLVLSCQEERTEIKGRSHRCPPFPLLRGARRAGD